jgi:hypothetical protein
MREPLCWPASASSTTRGSNAGPRGGSPRACWKGSPALYSSTRPSAPPDRSCARREQVAAGAPSSYSATRTPERAADPRLDDGDASLRAQRALDVLYANELGRALFSELFSDPSRPANSARYVFLDRRATDFFVDWGNIANDVVALLRAEAGRDPYDRALTDLIGELSTRSEEFRVRWAAHNVRFHRSGVKNFHHPVVGDLTLTYEALDLPGDPGQSIFVYMADANSA